MRPVEKTNVINKKFILISMAVLAVVFVVSIFADSGVIENADLSQDYNPHYTKLVISEICTSNNGFYVNAENKTTDYIEIYNGYDHPINLKGYGLSDRKDTIKWAFSDTVIEAKSYLIVSLDNDSSMQEIAPFRLNSKGGESLILTDSKRKVIDGVDTVSLNKGQIMFRDENGNWKISDMPTPGFENSLSGYQNYEDSLKRNEIPDICINELLIRNKGNYLNEDKSDNGFVELKNITDKVENLGEYYLSDDEKLPFKYRLEGSLNPGQLLIVDLNKDTLKLNAKNGYLLLCHNGTIVSRLDYSNLDNGFALSLNNNEYIRTSVVSPGYENSPEEIAEFEKNSLTENSLIISEVMNQNSSYLVQNSGNYYDWIELYNKSDVNISLADYSLSNVREETKMYMLPDVELAPGEYYVLMCSGNTELSNDSYCHTNFKIGESEGLFLYKGNELIDSMFVADVPLNYSYGVSNGRRVYMSDPSPGSENNDGFVMVSPSVNILTPAGIYDEPVIAYVEGPEEIYYTLDGSEPDTYSLKYIEGIKIDKTAVLKVRSFLNDSVMGKVSTASFIINENSGLPVISVSMNPGDFRALNSNSSSTVQRQCNIEYFEDGDGFNSPASISLFGGNARYQKKRAYCLRFDSKWGAGDLEYKLFDNRDNAVYDAFVLRTGSTDWVEAVIRDVVGTSLVDDYTNLDTQAYKSVNVFFNGDYWGIYNIREKVNSHYIPSHYNVPKESVNLFRIDGEVETGSKQEYDQLRQYCRENDLSIKENYDYVTSKIDPVSLADYWLCEGYFTNNDLLNVRIFSSSEYDNGRFHYIFYDLDFAWFNIGVNWYTQYLTAPGGMTDHLFENDIIKACLNNDEFRKLWLERMSYHCKNTFKTENVLNRIDEIVELYGDDMIRNQERWDLSYTTWLDEVEKLRRFARARLPVYLEHTRSFFHLSDEQMEEYFG